MVEERSVLVPCCLTTGCCRVSCLRLRLQVLSVGKGSQGLLCYHAGGVDSIGREEFKRLRRHSAAAERRRVQCEVANEVCCIASMLNSILSSPQSTLEGRDVRMGLKLDALLAKCAPGRSDAVHAEVSMSFISCMFWRGY